MPKLYDFSKDDCFSYFTITPLEKPFTKSNTKMQYQDYNLQCTKCASSYQWSKMNVTKVRTHLLNQHQVLIQSGQSWNVEQTLTEVNAMSKELQKQLPMLDQRFPGLSDTQRVMLYVRLSLAGTKSGVEKFILENPDTVEYFYRTLV